MGVTADQRSSFARSLSTIHLPMVRLDSDEDLAGNQQQIEEVNALKRTSLDLPALPFTDFQPVTELVRQASSSTQELAPRKKFQRRHSPTRSLDGEKKQASVLPRESSFNKKVGRSLSVTFAPTQPLSPKFNNESEHAVEHISSVEQHKTFRKDYELGDSIRCASHMMIEPTQAQAIEAVNSLQKHDFAFVKRSDGSYSYAILAYRSEASLTFVMNSDCSTKNVSKKHWGDFVGLVSMEGVDTSAELSNKCPDPLKLKESSIHLADSQSRRSKRTQSGVPRCISVVSDDDEISIISMPMC